ncbi:MAG: glycerol-3-phosphate 1-O-acyltransferase PlsY [Verrucomicrobia bacterium]|nr:glycerol-3-phosphate 1-O-acyltransferase PlsY [Verrucomicrobiota bacterium]
MIWLGILLLSYLLGSIPSGYLVAKSQGIDIRQHGSGNIGATNVLRVMGKKWGYLVFACDAMKGFLAVKLAAQLAGAGHANAALGAVLGAIGCILGHNYTVWLRFKGGKGIATSAGVLLGLFPLTVILTVLIIWLVVFLVGRYVSLASICAALSLPVAVFLLVTHAGIDFWMRFWFSVLISALAVWRHRGNLARLAKGTESRFTRR